MTTYQIIGWITAVIFAAGVGFLAGRLTCIIIEWEE